MKKIDLALLGPLANFVGTWEGSKGDDTAPGDDRGIEKNKFRELFVFNPFGPANNHEQTLYGLNYSRTAWRLGEEDPFHEQIGYWLWDAQAQLVMQTFLIPRGMTVLAGGIANTNTNVIKISAKLGSSTFGICSNPFLDREFKTVQYDSTITFLNNSEFSYEENTQIQIKGQSKIFDHIDKNTLKRVQS